MKARHLALRWREGGGARSDGDPDTDDGSGDGGGDGWKRRPVVIPAVCNTAIVRSMGKAGKLDEAFAWLKAAAALSATTAPDTGKEALRDGGEEERVDEPTLDHSTFLSVLSACSKAGRWETALEVLRLMDTAGVEAETIAFNTALAGAFEIPPPRLSAFHVQESEWEKEG